MPLGIGLSNLDPVWLNSMDTFGTDRGNYAHHSRRGHLANLPDPKTEYDRIKLTLTPGLADFDAKVLAA